MVIGFWIVTALFRLQIGFTAYAQLRFPTSFGGVHPPRRPRLVPGGSRPRSVRSEAIVLRELGHGLAGAIALGHDAGLDARASDDRLAEATARVDYILRPQASGRAQLNSCG